MKFKAGELHGKTVEEIEKILTEKLTPEEREKMKQITGGGKMKKSEMKQLKDYFEFLGFESVTFRGTDVIAEKTNEENGVTALFLVDAEEAFTRSLESAESFLQYVEDGREPE